MNPPTSIVCADHTGPCELCGAECWALVDGHRVHVITCWPMLTGGPAMTTPTTQCPAPGCPVQVCSRPTCDCQDHEWHGPTNGCCTDPGCRPMCEERNAPYEEAS